MTTTMNDTLRLIEAGFPCHQVGAETQRERDTGKAPPTHRLHVWWARRPLTAARASILAATLPSDASNDEFLEQLGMFRLTACLGEAKWVLNPKDKTLLRRLNNDGTLSVDSVVVKRIQAENESRQHALRLISDILVGRPELTNNSILIRWRESVSQQIEEIPPLGSELTVRREPADPSFAQDRISLDTLTGIRTPDDKYGYNRAFSQCGCVDTSTGLRVLDPTAGGGSIPFEALRLGHTVIANELNPVASVILHATLVYPREFGSDLTDDIAHWGEALRQRMATRMKGMFPEGDIPHDEQEKLSRALTRYPELVDDFKAETPDAYIYCRQVMCPHCGGQAPLLNSFWLSKEDGNRWAVGLRVDGPQAVQIAAFQITSRLSQQMLDELDAGTVTDGKGACAHCKQSIAPDEIQAQANGSSAHGAMIDRLYAVAGIRHEPMLKPDGEVVRFASGPRKGEIRTRKVQYYRSPADRDMQGLQRAEHVLASSWESFERSGVIPTESIPPGHKTGNEGGAGSGTDKPLKLGTVHWHEMFTPRQLLGHAIMVDELKGICDAVTKNLGAPRAKAVITYLQFAIDKGLDYNSRQTRWEYTRGVVKGTFSRHDYSFKWTFGEMHFTSDTVGATWCLNQIIEAYRGIAGLVAGSADTDLRIICGSAADMSAVLESSVDLVVNDPPYYDNVMYAELADFFYVWQKRTMAPLYPEYFDAYLTDKQAEAVANPHRDSSKEESKGRYEVLMGEIYSECHRVTKPDGRMVIMFTHKKQEAWESLTQALIDSGWTITASYPVDSESSNSMHIKDNASAESSIFLVCRKRDQVESEHGLWKAFGGQGVQQRIVDEVRAGLSEFEELKLRPVDTMIASYGRALRVLSEKWPVLDGDEPVSPIRALNEASRVVAQHHIQKLTEGRLKVEDLTPEAAMSVTLYGICGVQPIRYDEVLNIARSLGIAIESRPAGYDGTEKSIGYATEAAGRRASRNRDIVGYHAPLVRRGSNLRLALPDERNVHRLESPQHEWDVLQGMILKFREGDVPVARAYLAEHADGQQTKILDLLRVWTNEADNEDLRKEGETMLFGLGAE